MKEVRKSFKDFKRSLPEEDYVYSTPIFIPKSGESSVELITIRVSIIFNFAIARHLRSLTMEGTKRENKLRTTLKLYHWVLSIERSIKEDNSLFGAMPCLGLINNCAQIHRFLHKVDEADKMFRLLLSSIMLLKEREEDSDTWELDGFLSATSHLILKRPGVARAA